MNWYYKNGDQEIGPVADEAMKALIRKQTVNSDTLVRLEDTEEWIQLSKTVFCKRTMSRGVPLDQLEPQKG